MFFVKLRASEPTTLFPLFVLSSALKPMAVSLEFERMSWLFSMKSTPLKGCGDFQGTSLILDPISDPIRHSVNRKIELLKGFR